MLINSRENQRYVFESAYKSMLKYGKRSMMSKKILARREEVESSMLRYYESTEEFEKCKYILDFFKDLEETLREGQETMNIENLQ
jgi:hypothetical protein